MTLNATQRPANQTEAGGTYDVVYIQAEMIDLLVNLATTIDFLFFLFFVSFKPK